MGRILKLIVVIGILGFAGLVGFAYLGDLQPDRETISEPMVLDVN